MRRFDFNDSGRLGLEWSETSVAQYVEYRDVKPDIRALNAILEILRLRRCIRA